MRSATRLPAFDARLVWVGLGLLSVAVGIRYSLTEPLIFEPGGWFALDGRRVLDAASAWRQGLDPYSVSGFLCSPAAARA